MKQKITKEQYICSLYNMHQFVKYTTRIAARCVLLSKNRELRNHYLAHLKGEINHEVIIESDLQALGADVDYLIYDHVPHIATNEFIVVQESTVGFKQDPILMLSCPFVAEGMTANVSPELIDNLHAVIRSWGYKNPEKSSRFLTSHLKVDGGDDGHWAKVTQMIAKFVDSEHLQQEFLNNMRLAMRGYARGFNANIDDLQLWSKADE